MMATSPSLVEEVPVAKWVQEPKQCAIQDLIGISAFPGLTSFALGLPAPELFPVEAVGHAARRALSSGPDSLQYGAPFESLKTQIVEVMGMRGVECTESQVLLTSGAQQALSLLVHLFLDSGGPLVVEQITYSGFIVAADPLQPDIVAVPTDAEKGMDLDALESVLSAGIRPAMIYAMADGHNPLGARMNLENRLRLVDLAHSYRVPIVEDDPYGLLSYSNDFIPPLRALNPDWVCYVGTFSKILAPAMRVGWIIAPEGLIRKLAYIKEGSDMDTNSFSQRVISAYLDSGHLPAHVNALRAEYRKRRDTMLRSLSRHFPSGARWFVPSSGMFIWVELPGATNTARVLKTAMELEQIAYVPGQEFSVGADRDAANCLRLNFSCNTHERIEDGIRRLAPLLDGE